MSKSKNQTISEVLVVVGIAAFAYYKYSKMTAAEKEKVHADIKEIGENVVKGLAPEAIKNFLPARLK